MWLAVKIAAATSAWIFTLAIVAEDTGLISPGETAPDHGGPRSTTRGQAGSKTWRLFKGKRNNFLLTKQRARQCSAPVFIDLNHRRRR